MIDGAGGEEQFGSEHIDSVSGKRQWTIFGLQRSRMHRSSSCGTKGGGIWRAPWEGNDSVVKWGVSNGA